MLQWQKGLREQKKTYRELNNKLKALWGEHENSKINTEELLSKIAETYTKINTAKYGETADDSRELELEVV